MIKDFTLHFTVKGQNISDIERVFENADLPFHNDLTSIQLHHCFLTKEEVIQKGFSTSVVDMLERCSDNIICWNKSSETLFNARANMITTVNRAHGTAIFIGDIIEGVLEEYNLAEQSGINIIKIPIKHKEILHETGGGE